MSVCSQLVRELMDADREHVAHIIAAAIGDDEDGEARSRRLSEACPDTLRALCELRKRTGPPPARAYIAHAALAAALVMPSDGGVPTLRAWLTRVHALPPFPLPEVNLDSADARDLARAQKHAKSVAEMIRDEYVTIYLASPQTGRGGGGGGGGVTRALAHARAASGRVTS